MKLSTLIMNIPFERIPADGKKNPSKSQLGYSNPLSVLPETAHGDKEPNVLLRWLRESFFFPSAGILITRG
jgi:hypothetical protein